MNNISSLYLNRFTKKELLARNKIWKVLCELSLQKYVNKSDLVIDLGAGYCELINNIHAKEKAAIDINRETKKHAGQKVTVVNCMANKIPERYLGKADVIFISNLLEHLENKRGVFDVLDSAKRALKRNGRIVILQPNIDLVKEKYWDFIDHNIALNGKSVKEALKLSGFVIEEYIERFFPYSTKSNLPQNPLFVRLYLGVPPLLRPFAGQSLFVARKI